MRVEKTALFGSECAVVNEDQLQLSGCEQPQSQSQTAKSRQPIDKNGVTLPHFGGKNANRVAEAQRYVAAPPQTLLRDLHVGRMPIRFNAHNG